MRMKPTAFPDLIALVALYRPGPLGSGMVDEFINRKHGKVPVKYELPILENILQETYGIIVYQEQVMQIASALAGFSLGDADILRRARGKKKADEMAGILLPSKGMKSLGRYGAVGFELLLSIAVGYYLGRWADGKLGTRWLALVGFLVGCYAGFRALFRDVLEHGIDRLHETARLLERRIAFARIGCGFGGRCRIGGRRHLILGLALGEELRDPVPCRRLRPRRRGRHGEQHQSRERRGKSRAARRSAPELGRHLILLERADRAREFGQIDGASSSCPCASRHALPPP